MGRGDELPPLVCLEKGLQGLEQGVHSKCTQRGSEIFVHFIYFSISNTFAYKVPYCNLPRENIEFSVVN